jgi:hypothetical protein
MNPIMASKSSRRIYFYESLPKKARPGNLNARHRRPPIHFPNVIFDGNVKARAPLELTQRALARALVGLLRGRRAWQPPFIID